MYDIDPSTLCTCLTLFPIFDRYIIGLSTKCTSRKSLKLELCATFFCTTTDVRRFDYNYQLTGNFGITQVCIGVSEDWNVSDNWFCYLTMKTP